MDLTPNEYLSVSVRYTDGYTLSVRKELRYGHLWTKTTLEIVR